MPLLAVLTLFVPCLAETIHFACYVHESNRELQLPALSLTLFLQFWNESHYLRAKAKQQYKERQLHNGFSDLPWTGISFKPCNEYSRLYTDLQEL